MWHRCSFSLFFVLPFRALRCSRNGTIPNRDQTVIAQFCGVSRRNYTHRIAMLRLSDFKIVLTIETPPLLRGLECARGHCCRPTRSIATRSLYLVHSGCGDFVKFLQNYSKVDSGGRVLRAITCRNLRGIWYKSPSPHLANGWNGSRST